MSKSKFTYPKCPYCKKEYQDGVMEYDLMNLVTQGWCKEVKVKCHSCGEYFKVKAHITYYGSKLARWESENIFSNFDSNFSIESESDFKEKWHKKDIWFTLYRVVIGICFVYNFLLNRE